MKKSTWYILGGSLLIFLIMGTQKAFAKIVDNQKFRDCDPQGCGSFDANRVGHKHQGVDIITLPNQIIKSPITGQITRYPFPDGSDLTKKGIEIVNNIYKVKIFYVEGIVPIGTNIVAGEKIAIAQNIMVKYGAGMTNHAHFEAYKKQGNNWVLIDPTNLF
ncbi:hypothetical protein [Flavobacterium sp. J27]|uniref:hypothetical protein n=1 Tax=Flavobacterium sp. J27 TaxID=2060419 RepID=UPI00102FDA9D|nr:hypothetical protein [Flavobacterium sp. J27]